MSSFDPDKILITHYKELEITWPLRFIGINLGKFFNIVMQFRNNTICSNARTENYQKPTMYLLQEIIITELGFAKHKLIQLQTSARRAGVM